MDSVELTKGAWYQALVEQISLNDAQGREPAYQAIHQHLVETYWKVGQPIVEFEQGGQSRAEYGEARLDNLAQDLSLRHGKGFLLDSNLVACAFSRFKIVTKRTQLR